MLPFARLAGAVVFATAAAWLPVGGAQQPLERLRRGIDPALYSSYPSAEDVDGGVWSCLKSGERKRLPTSCINDEFCDCSDGSDEPGSAACSHFRTSTFWCANKGYQSEKIFSSRVNDGLCDCCDGSDEYLTGVCGDECAALAEDANRKIKARADVVRAALAEKNNIIQQGRAKREEQQQELVRLKSELSSSASGYNELKAQHEAFASAEKVRQDLEAKQAEPESQAEPKPDSQQPAAAVEGTDSAASAEQATAAGGTDADCGPVLSGEVAEPVEVQVGEEWENGTVAAVNGDGTFNITLSDNNETEKDVPTERVRARFASCGALDLDARATASCGEKSRCGDSCLVICKDGYAGTTIAYHCGADGEWNTTSSIECELMAPLTPHITKLTALDEAVDVEFVAKEANEATYTVTATPQHDGEGKETATATATASDGGSVTVRMLENEILYKFTIEAKNAKGTAVATGVSAVAPSDLKSRFTAAENARKKSEEKVEDLEASRDKQDWGADLQFSQLSGKCVEKDFGKFAYKVCGFDKVEQRDGSSWTNLGRFSSWSNNYTKMRFEHGTKCWNGPERSTTVALECGVSDQLLKVSEPETCTYLISMATPSVCQESDIPKFLGEQKQGHEEL